MSFASRFFARNWTLKLSALGIALLLWVAVRVDAPTRAELTNIPVRVDIQDPQWELLEEPLPTSVTVRLSGSSGDLIRIVGERPSLVIPVDDIHSPDTTVLLRNQWVRMQDRAGVAVEGIVPSSVRLTLEPVERLSLPPLPRLEGSLPDRLALAQAPTVHPAEVRVIGPRSRIMQLDSVPLMPVELGEVRGSGRVTVEVDTARVSGLTIQPLSVEVELQVEDRIDRVVSGIPVSLPEALQPADQELETLPRTATVILHGARSVVERADPRELRLVVEVEEDALPEPGEEASFALRLTGLPPFLTATLQQASVLIRRLEEEDP